MPTSEPDEPDRSATPGLAPTVTHPPGSGERAVQDESGFTHGAGFPQSAGFTHSALLAAVTHSETVFVELDEHGVVLQLSRPAFGLTQGRSVFTGLTPESEATLKQTLLHAVAQPVGFAIAWSSAVTADEWAICQVMASGETASNATRLLMLTDLSTRRRSQLVGEKVKLELRQRQKLEAIGALASGVAHEISNPIQGIVNYAELIRDTRRDDAAVVEYATEITRETERVSHLIKNLLDFARHESQRHSPAQIADIIENSVGLLHSAFMKDQIQVELDLPKALPALKCRSQQLQQVLLNLLNNARDALNQRYAGFHPDKRLHISASVFTEQDMPWMRVAVADRGAGFDAALLDQLFEPFFTTKSRETHSGLGLSVSLAIMRDHHGHLQLLPSADGSAAVMELPINNGWSLDAG